MKYKLSSPIWIWECIPIWAAASRYHTCEATPATSVAEARLDGMHATSRPLGIEEVGQDLCQPLRVWRETNGAVTAVCCNTHARVLFLQPLSRLRQRQCVAVAKNYKRIFVRADFPMNIFEEPQCLVRIRVMALGHLGLLGLLALIRVIAFGLLGLLCLLGRIGRLGLIRIIAVGLVDDVLMPGLGEQQAGEHLPKPASPKPLDQVFAVEPREYRWPTVRTPEEKNR
mmetsp:Transcript_110092/g.350705  ORF Transcript_110092/g.350705 Transcript_110092/m.350705 type:complete len:227 (+) Transcript_110092:190-870(+)